MPPEPSARWQTAQLAAKSFAPAATDAAWAALGRTRATDRQMGWMKRRKQDVINGTSKSPRFFSGLEICSGTGLNKPLAQHKITETFACGAGLGVVREERGEQCQDCRFVSVLAHQFGDA